MTTASMPAVLTDTVLTTTPTTDTALTETARDPEPVGFVPVSAARSVTRWTDDDVPLLGPAPTRRPAPASPGVDVEPHHPHHRRRHSYVRAQRQLGLMIAATIALGVVVLLMMIGFAIVS
jgi:hypothetical protein